MPEKPERHLTVPEVVSLGGGRDGAWKKNWVKECGMKGWGRRREEEEGGGGRGGGGGGGVTLAAGVHLQHQLSM